MIEAQLFVTLFWGLFVRIFPDEIHINSVALPSIGGHHLIS